jgi:starch-binding outer membrane protein, SusD/RagB family
MTHHRISVWVPVRPGRLAALSLALLALAPAAGCGGLLDVENPNNIAEQSLDDPQSAEQQANGVLASAGGMLATVMARYATATDELDWIGSRDGWRELDRGVLSNPSN